MKKLLPVILCLLLVCDLGSRLMSPSIVQAQTSVGALQAGLVVSSLSNCAWATGATVTSGVALCFVNTGTASTSGLYFALNGGTTWTPVASASGVTSFNGRTGAVVPTAGDYSYSQLSSLPTTTGTCTGGTLAGTGTITASSAGSVSLTLTSGSLTGCPF